MVKTLPWKFQRQIPHNQNAHWKISVHFFLSFQGVGLHSGTGWHFSAASLQILLFWGLDFCLDFMGVRGWIWAEPNKSTGPLEWKGWTRTTYQLSQLLFFLHSTDWILRKTIFFGAYRTIAGNSEWNWINLINNNIDKFQTRSNLGKILIFKNKNK